MVEHLFAHIRLNINPQLVPPISDDKVQQCIQQIDTQQPDASPNNPRPVPSRKQFIDNLIDGQREPKLQQPCHHRTSKIQNK